MVCPVCAAFTTEPDPYILVQITESGREIKACLKENISFFRIYLSPLLEC